MSPKAAAEFGRQWPELQRKLRLFLRGKGVPTSEIDDVVQEVAARLVSYWHKIDVDRPLWPLTVTITLNLLRDRSRRRNPECLGEIPDVAGPNDVADSGIARLELAEVLKAMDSLTPAQRSALLKVIEPENGRAESSASEKMLRMRARRRLANAVGRACGGLAIKSRRVGEALQGFFTKADGMAQALACATCLFVASAGSATLYQAFPNLGSDMTEELQAPPRFEEVSVAVGAATESFASDEQLSPGRSAVATTPDRVTRSSRRAVGGTTTRPKRSPGNAQSGGSQAHLGVQNTPVVPSDPPGLPPEPPSAPDQPVEPPDVGGETPSPPSDSPVQSPTGDQPLGTVEEAASAVEDATRR